MLIFGDRSTCSLCLGLDETEAMRFAEDEFYDAITLGNISATLIRRAAAARAIELAA